MGYVNTLPFNFFEVGNTHQLNNKTLTTVAQDIDFTPIVIPDYIGTRVDHAYLDIYFPWIENTNAGENHIEQAQKIRVSDAPAGVYEDAVSLGDQTFALPGSSTSNANIRRIGTWDIGNIVTLASGGWLYIKWVDAKSHSDSMVFRFMYAILRVMSK